ncbi:NAD-dependent epimerase/dehydratase family protein [Elusimicrobiota bacterium]
MEEAGVAERVLVFGATGFIGSNLVRHLSASGLRVTVFRRADSNLRNLEGCSFDDVVGDLESPEDVAGAVGNCRVVFNLAACTSQLDRDAEERERVNVGFVKILADTMSRTGGARLIHCSSVATIGFRDKPMILDENSTFDASGIHYFDTKKRGEDLILERAGKDLEAVIVNPGTVIGSRGMRTVQARAFLRAATGRLRFYPPGGTCFAFVDDVVRGMLLARRRGHSGQRYILGGTNITFQEYFIRVARIGKVRPPGIRLPARLLPAAGRAMELFLGTMGRDSGRLAAGFGYYSSEKAKRDLGYEITPLDAALARMYGELVSPDEGGGGS